MKLHSSYLSLPEAELEGLHDDCIAIEKEIRCKNLYVGYFDAFLRCLKKEKQEPSIKSCPFCGNRPEIDYVTGQTTNREDIPIYYIECRNSLCCHPGAKAYSRIGAIKKWNRRSK